ncbi:MAG: glycosyltransferase family 39 protein [Deltaproteobacteria bacterium]|nr:glycosyltransferase family 39 protein [Deltaproteobacteria bacterium]
MAAGRGHRGRLRPAGYRPAVPPARPQEAPALSGPSFRLLGALLLAAAALLYGARLGATGFWAPDEPRYGHVAEEIRAGRHGAAGLVLLHVNGEPYTQKPPLYFWLAAAAGAPRGRVSEVAARLPSALAGVALVGVVLLFGRRLLDARSALLGAALLLTGFELADNARRVQLDVLLTLCETLALAAFWRLDRGRGRPAASQAWLHGALGLAVLTKGPVGFLVPVLVMAAFLAWEGRLRALRRVFPWWGPLLSIAPALAWIAGAVALAPPGFFGEAVLDNLFGRFFAGTSHERPFYYYLYQFPLNFLPWFLLAPAVWSAARREVFAPGADPGARRSWRFLLAWVAITLVFFSLSSGKRGIYALTCHPAAALLVADAVWRRACARGGVPPLVHAATALLATGLAAGGIGVALADPLRDPAASLATGGAALAIAALGAVAAVVLPRAAAPLGARLALPVAMVFGFELVLFTVTWPARDPEKSPRSLAEAAAALTPEEGAIGLVGDRALTGGLAYYGRRRVAPLESPEEIARFFASGGRAVVVQARKLDRVEAAAPVAIAFRAREGRRQLVVATPRSTAGE